MNDIIVLNSNSDYSKFEIGATYEIISLNDQDAYSRNLEHASLYHLVEYSGADPKFPFVLTLSGVRSNGFLMSGAVLKFIHSKKMF